MRPARGMTLAELVIALAVTSMVGAGVVAMTDAVARVLDDGRLERERTIASASASTRLASLVAPSRCVLEAGDDLVVLWKSDTFRDRRVQASELGWVRFLPATGELRYEWVSFPEGWSARDRAEADRHCHPEEDWERVRDDYESIGHLNHCVLLDGLRDARCAMPEAELEAPLDLRRLAWRLDWAGEIDVSTTTVIAAGIHGHEPPEDRP